MRAPPSCPATRSGRVSLPGPSGTEVVSARPARASGASQGLGDAQRGKGREPEAECGETPAAQEREASGAEARGGHSGQGGPIGVSGCPEWARPVSVPAAPAAAAPPGPRSPRAGPARGPGAAGGDPAACMGARGARGSGLEGRDRGPAASVSRVRLGPRRCRWVLGAASSRAGRRGSPGRTDSLSPEAAWLGAGPALHGARGLGCTGVFSARRPSTLASGTHCCPGVPGPCSFSLPLSTALPGVPDPSSSSSSPPLVGSPLPQAPAPAQGCGPTCSVR